MSKSLLFNPELPSDLSIQYLEIGNDLEFYLREVPEVLKNPILDRGQIPQKQIESLACRYLLSQLLHNLKAQINPIEYSTEGKPFLKNGFHFSFSHTNQYACCALSKNKSIGIDLEMNHRSIEKIATRFLSTEELVIFCDKKSQILAWSIKEAIYKAHEKRGLSFREQIRLQFKDGLYFAEVMDQEKITKYKLYYTQNNLFTICVAVPN
jgi:phosphopantetheinyl transferase